MVTKWKNTKSLKRFFHENRRTALGILMAAAGIVVLTAMSQRVGFLNTKITWCIGVPADALLLSLIHILVILIGYWTVIPKEVISDSALYGFAGSTGIYLLITHMGTVISLKQLIQQWRTVVVCLVGLAGMMAVSYTHLDVYKRQPY